MKTFVRLAAGLAALFIAALVQAQSSILTIGPDPTTATEINGLVLVKGAVDAQEWKVSLSHWTEAAQCLTTENVPGTKHKVRWPWPKDNTQCPTTSFKIYSEGGRCRINLLLVPGAQYKLSNIPSSLGSGEECNFFYFNTPAPFVGATVTVDSSGVPEVQVDLAKNVTCTADQLTPRPHPGAVRIVFGVGKEAAKSWLTDWGNGLEEDRVYFFTTTAVTCI